MKYCSKNSLTYQIVYDIDLGYREFKKYLKANPLVIEKYQIKFSNPKYINFMVIKVTDWVKQPRQS